MLFGTLNRSFTFPKQELTADCLWQDSVEVWTVGPSRTFLSFGLEEVAITHGATQVINFTCISGVSSSSFRDSTFIASNRLGTDRFGTSMVIAQLNLTSSKLIQI